MNLNFQIMEMFQHFFKNPRKSSVQQIQREQEQDLKAMRGSFDSFVG